MQKDTYYNTTNLTGSELDERIKACTASRDAVMSLFKFYWKLTPSKAHDALTIHGVKRKWPLTSIRRAITNLKNDGLLVKTNEKSIGRYGYPEYNYELNFNEIINDTNNT